MRLNAKYNIIWLILIAILFTGLSALQSASLLNTFLEQILILIGINIILAVGLNLVIGVAGQFSLGHAGFMAIGAYTAAIVTLKSPTYLAFAGALLLAMVLSGLIALVVGIPTLRLKGDYLAIATLGVAEIIRICIINMEKITNGPAGLFAIPLYVNWQVAFICVVLTTLITVNYIHSGSGLATLAVRDNEIAAEAMGVNTTKSKVVAFVLGAMTASIAGVLYATTIQTVTPKDFGFMKSIDILIIVVFGGIGSITGSFIAAIMLGILNMFLQDFGEMRMIVYALALIVVMIFKPSGLLGTKEFSVKSLLTVKEGKR
ncbi:MAG: branched-chain amino acid ABC transporter permease [Streptococcaceae bacterium]|jgi:branched-chain amino acid transport system permease protein|nr:branched-chain amino acid ABC transporter permease [Streptococcaceae bacterium]